MAEEAGVKPHHLPTNEQESTHLMFHAMKQEFLLAHQPRNVIERYERRIELLRRTISGFETNATACKACAMSRELAANALERDDRIRQTANDQLSPTEIGDPT